MGQNTEDFAELQCGCTVLNYKIFGYCPHHYDNQPKFGDPLNTWMRETAEKEFNEKLGLTRPTKDQVTEFDFFNDTKKSIHVRIVPTSYEKNPEVIFPLEIKKLYVRPNGFMKLWDCGDKFVLLVD